MVQRICGILVVLLWIGKGEIFSQNLCDSASFFPHPGTFSNPSERPASPLVFNRLFAVYTVSFPSRPVLQPISRQPFFCRIEAAVEKKTSIPLRVRLGSLAYTDYLEKKTGAGPRHP